MIIPGKIKFIGLGVIVIGAFLGGMKYESGLNASALLKAKEKLHEYTKSMDEKVETLNLANAITSIELNKANQLLKQERAIERQIPIYTECTVPSTGVQLYNRAAEGLTSPAS